MRRPTRVADILIIVVKAILITAAIIFLGRFFGLNVREAGGDVIVGGAVLMAISVHGEADLSCNGGGDVEADRRKV